MKSIGSYLLLLSDRAINQKQKYIAEISAEVTHIALSECVRELRNLRKVMDELSDDTDMAVKYEDSEKCIWWREVHGKHTKSVDLRCDMSRKAVANSEAALEYCST